MSLKLSEEELKAVRKLAEMAKGGERYPLWVNKASFADIILNRRSLADSLLGWQRPSVRDYCTQASDSKRARQTVRKDTKAYMPAFYSHQ